MLTIESNMNKLEDKVVLTARSLLKLTTEMKIQLFEIKQLKKTIINIHKYIVRQSERIDELEGDIDDVRAKQKPKSLFNINESVWSKLFK